MRGRSGRKLEIVLWLGLVAVLLLVVALAFAVPVLVGVLQLGNSAAPLPRPVHLVIQMSDFVLTKWYLIVAAGLVGSIAAALSVWGKRERAASS